MKNNIKKKITRIGVPLATASLLAIPATKLIIQNQNEKIETKSSIAKFNGTTSQQNASAPVSVDKAHAEQVIQSYASKMDSAYSGKNIAVPEQSVSDKLTAPGTYMPFLDIGMVFWGTLQGVTDTFKTNKQNLYYGSFLTAPNRGFKDEGGNEGWSSTALTNLMNSVNYNYEHIGPKTAGQDFDIPVAYGGGIQLGLPGSDWSSWYSTK